MAQKKAYQFRPDFLREFKLEQSDINQAYNHLQDINTVIFSYSDGDECEGVNLDAYVSADDLSRFNMFVSAPRHLLFGAAIFPRSLCSYGPTAIVECMHSLERYAAFKALAMRARESGRVDDASRYESKCERIYATLPAWASW